MESSNLGSIQITNEKILVVEGIEEQRFLKSYFRFLSVSNIQILPIGGKTQLKGRLKALANESNFISIVKVLGIIRDADTSADSAFQSVCSSLKNARLPVPSAPLIFSGIIPKVIVLIMPPNSPSGNLEELCLHSVVSDSAIPCLKSYFSCLNSLPQFTMPKEMAKAKVHAFLASRQEPDKRLGEAAEAGYWPFRDPSFDSLKNFILSL